MGNRTILILVAAAAFFFLVLNKRKSGVVYAGAGGAPVPKPSSPRPAIPNPSTGQILAGAAVKAAPQIISALGSFFNSNDDSGSSDESDSFDSSADDFSFGD